MNKPWKLVLVLLGIFLAGGVTGAFLTKKFGRDWVVKRPGPEQWAPSHLKRLVERLALTAEQEAELAPIVQRHMEELSHMRNESMAAGRAAYEKMEREISEKLSPEQRVKYEQLNKEMRERGKKDPRKNSRPVGPGAPSPGEPPSDSPPKGNPPSGG